MGGGLHKTWWRDFFFFFLNAISIFFTNIFCHCLLLRIYVFLIPDCCYFVRAYCNKLLLQLKSMDTAYVKA